MKNMKLLVTGGAGFIGSNFINYWLNEYKDDSIVNLDVLTYAGNLENLKIWQNDSRYRFVKGDILEKDLVRDLVNEVDIVVHFAAESHVDRSIHGPEIFTRTNVLGTQTLLEAAKEFGKRFHHVSTDEVFGSLALNEPASTEDSPYRPRSPYAASKAASDHLVRAYGVTYNLPVTISNTSNNYGPYHFPEKIIPLFITNLIDGKKVPVYGDGLQVRDWIHVLDHCRGIDLVLKKGRIGETYLFGGENQTTNLELTKMILDLLDIDETFIEHVEDRKGHDRRYDINCEKARTELGWERKIELNDGLKETVQWFLDNEDWWRRCKNGEYLKFYQQNYKMN
jgi:dTDP-glucose 4,6-dehydratase